MFWLKVDFHHDAVRFYGCNITGINELEMHLSFDVLG